MHNRSTTESTPITTTEERTTNFLDAINIGETTKQAFILNYITITFYWKLIIKAGHHVKLQRTRELTEKRPESLNLININFVFF